MRRGLLAPELGALVERVLQRDIANRHKHTFRYEGPSAVLPGCDVHRCMHCPKIAIRRREAC